MAINVHFTKWADAIHFANQKANTIVKALINLFATMGLPDIVHRDQEQILKCYIMADFRSIWNSEVPHYSLPFTR